MVIEFIGLSKRYGKKSALQNFSAVLHPGVYGLLGANGAGKTTLISLLVGVLVANDGCILIDGHDARSLGKKFLSKIGYLPQYPEFYRDFTVKEFLRYICALKNIPDKSGWMNAQELLSEVNLPNVEQKKNWCVVWWHASTVGHSSSCIGQPKYPNTRRTYRWIRSAGTYSLP